MSDMDERIDRVVKISKPPKSIEAWLGDGSSEPRAIDSLTAYNWVYALLADREALVRYVRASHLLENEHPADGGDFGELPQLVNQSWQALSQELRDEINAI